MSNPSSPATPLGNPLIPSVITTAPPRVSADGLRYKAASKAPGSPFEQRNAESIRSCFLCGQHKSVQQGVFKKLAGKQQFICNECMKARAGVKSAKAAAPTPTNSRKRGA